jgi:hypothetical protein
MDGVKFKFRIKDPKDTIIDHILQDLSLDDKTAILDKVKQLIDATTDVNETVS